MRRPIRQSKIVATLGPKSSSKDIIEKLIEAGTDVFRLNTSHGKPADHIKRAQLVRSIAEKNNRNVAILLDLQGPKIRIEKFIKNEILLTDNQRFTLDADCDPEGGDEHRVAIAYRDLATQISKGKRLLLDDGKIILEVLEINGVSIVCEVITGGSLGSRKGINIEGGGLKAEAFTEDDRNILIDLYNKGVDFDYVALSFVNSAQDLHDLSQFLKQQSIQTSIIAKIETRIGLQNLAEIAAVADAVMIARGDLGVEIGDERLPAAQKQILRVCSSLNRPVITATQMMESMVDSPIPTRAEVIDVATAVAAGTDAIMLSAETATGNFPVQAVIAMDRIARAAEQEIEESLPKAAEGKRSHKIDQTVAMAAVYSAAHSEITAIVALTESGNTALLMSRYPVAQNIYALTPSRKSASRMALFRGVHPILFDFHHDDHGLLIQQCVQYLVKEKFLEPSECIALTKGSQLKMVGGTNILGIYRVADLLGLAAKKNK